MATDRLYVLGAGGHAKVVLDAIAAAPQVRYSVVVVDDDPRRVGSLVLNHPIQARPKHTAMAGHGYHLAIGQGGMRARLHQALAAAGAQPVTVQHPAATRAESATVGPGCFLAAHAIVGPDARIGSSVILNHGAVVDHDCFVGDFAHIAPNATLGGGVEIGAGVLVGAGATILPGVRIGTGAVIAAGATIIRDVAAGETVILTLTRKR